MPELARFYGIIVKMYYSDHNPPHFHAEYEDYNAEYEIQTLDILAGRLPPRAHALILEWASLHKNELIENWKNAKIPVKLNKIEPLK